MKTADPAGVALREFDRLLDELRNRHSDLQDIAMAELSGSNWGRVQELRECIQIVSIARKRLEVHI